MTTEETFRKKYTFINEETIRQAGLDNPELLKDMILVPYFSPFTISLLIEGLGNLTLDKYFDFILSYLNHENPFIQEGVILSLSEYYVEKPKKYNFIKALLENKLKDTPSEGVKKQISAQLYYMKFMTT